MRRANREPARPLKVPARRIRAMRNRLLEWYRVNGRTFTWRKKPADLYVRVLTEVLVQQTRAESVAAFLPGFVSRFPSWSALSKATLRDLETALKPLGLWRRRARAISNLAGAISALGGHWPKTREGLEQMPAVGQYVASAIMLFVHGQPEPLLDVNMARVLERYFGPRLLADIRYDPYLQDLSRRLVMSNSPDAVNWGVLDFGALICTARRPKCDDCPLRRGCRFYRQLLHHRDDTVVSSRRPLG